MFTIFSFSSIQKIYFEGFQGKGIHVFQNFSNNMQMVLRELHMCSNLEFQLAGQSEKG
ncbi:uncharacterized protein METZ01_LOCUS278406 [marine metagenome]|uniref:Uncharacterized protein n=1 Tax=marine metagenome TaxID=408172 RepID=A0A382KQN9_9ZZZZ